MHLRFNFDACPMHSPFGFMHLTHQNFSAHALFCLNSLAKVNTQLLIYNQCWTTDFGYLPKCSHLVSQNQSKFKTTTITYHHSSQIFFNQLHRFLADALVSTIHFTSFATFQGFEPVLQLFQTFCVFTKNVCLIVCLIFTWVADVFKQFWKSDDWGKKYIIL